MLEDMRTMGNNRSPQFLSELRKGIIECFESSELIIMCADLGVNYQNLAGDGMEIKVLELISYMSRRGQISRLEQYCQNERPGYAWPQEGASQEPAAPIREDPDEGLCEFYRKLFDRPAFSEPMEYDTGFMRFSETINLIIKAINTGVVFDRHGNQLEKYTGRTWLADEDLQSKLENIKKHLHTAKRLSEKSGPGGKDIRETIAEIDAERHAIITTLNRMLSKFNIPPSPVPAKGKDNAGSLKPRKKKQMQKILFLSADTSNATRLRVDEEYREIDEQLKLAMKRDQFDLVKPRLSVRVKDITGALLDEHPQIVHFSGHGTAEGALCFEKENGETQIVEPDALAALFEQFKEDVNCVMLNACYAEAQAKAISKHIDYVIGMNDAIGQKAAIAFSLGFYQALGAGEDIDKAFELGKVQIRLQGIPEYLTPVLIKGKDEPG